MKRRRKLDWVARLIENAVYLYIMFACLWSICWLVGEIFQKLGVA